MKLPTLEQVRDYLIDTNKTYRKSWKGDVKTDPNNPIHKIIMADASKKWQQINEAFVLAEAVNRFVAEGKEAANV